jgi:regulator of replication initiation timing
MYMCIEISMDKDSLSMINEIFQKIWENKNKETQNEIDDLNKRLLKEQKKNNNLGIENDLLKQKVSELEVYKAEHDKYEEEFQLFLYRRQQEEKIINSINNEHNPLLEFVGLCEWVDNIEEKEVSLAPTEYEDIFYHYKNWCQQQAYKPPDKKRTKAELLMIQKQSKYGLKIGKRTIQRCPNGTDTKPRFNLRYEPE